MSLGSQSTCSRRNPLFGSTHHRTLYFFILKRISTLYSPLYLFRHEMNSMGRILLCWRSYCWSFRQLAWVHPDSFYLKRSQCWRSWYHAWSHQYHHQKSKAFSAQDVLSSSACLIYFLRFCHLSCWWSLTDDSHLNVSWALKHFLQLSISLWS